VEQINSGDPGYLDDDRLPAGDQEVKQAIEDLDADKREGSTVNILRIPDPKKPTETEYIAEMSVAEYLQVRLEGIRADYGGGTFLIRIREPSGKWVARKKINVANLPRARAASPGLSGGSESMVILQAINEGNRTMLEGMRAIAEGFKAAIQPPSAPLTISQVLTDIAAMRTLGKDLFPGEGKGKSLLEQIREAKALAAELTPAGGAGAVSPMDRTLTMILDLIAAKGKEPAAAPALPPGQLEDPAMIEFRENLKQLCTLAAQNYDPKAIANQIGEKLPDHVWDILIGETWLQVLTTAWPQCGNFKPWFTDLRNALVAGLTDGAKPNQTTGNKDTGNGAKPSKDSTNA
jgi:hypothetical protein